jgi:FAD:protein FMN transferase
MRRRQFLATGTGIAAAAATMYGWNLFASAGMRHYRGASLAFGTTVSIQVLHDDEHAAMEAIDAAFSAAAEIESLMSLYRADSQVSVLNATGRLEDPHPHLLRVLRTSQALSARTGGAFDVTVQPLWEPSFRGTDRTQALRKVGWQHLVLDQREVRLQRPGMAITLNGIAQGYATDVALAALRSRGIRHALVDIGELRNEGHGERDAPWRVGIEDPRREAAMIAAVAMDGRGVATSADNATRFGNPPSSSYQSFSDHHIWNPANGRSPQELASVTVFAPDAMLADGLSTAIMVLGKQAGMRLAREMDGVDVLMIDKQGKTFRTAGVPFV